ncbi:male-specific lethal 3 homolog isoform X3 [Scleropages formosus]|uniref:male-specific lethal 3 homolog isoform X3 n=1 Tax=Scleropages formosus TaxID=113540 RepID=UPI0010FAB688|nr:male-specific lethal 3 homolog isoform X3 [Scleropages formosus]
MNSRGMKFKFRFRQGDKVLCFEPDPKKAKVLYDAKVIDVIVTKDKRGRRVPKYLIHFSGWSRSWDRWSAQERVLPDTVRTRRLQCTLARRALARMRRKGWKKRRGRLPAINPVLKHLSEEKLESHDASSEYVEEDKSEDQDSLQSEDSYTVIEDLYEMKEEQDTSSRRESEERSISIEIPDVLKKKLEDDCYYINKKKKLVKIPCQMNVVSILESYVKHFAINATFSADERYWHRAGAHASLSSHCGRPEKNEELCKEMVDGLRITFDFTLPMILLYPSEHAQFKKVSSSKFFLPSRDATTSLNRMAPECPPASPKLEPSTPPQADSRPPLNQSTTPKRRRGDRDSLHSLRRSARCSPGGDRSSRSGVSPRPKRRLADRAIPTSRLPLGQEKKTPGHSGSSSPRLAASPRKEGSWLISSPESRRNNRLSEVLSWKLTPENYPQRDRPPPPSCMYGAQHLLRLFVKLPEILGKMHLPDRNLRTLVTHLELFLRYTHSFCPHQSICSHCCKMKSCRPGFLTSLISTSTKITEDASWFPVHLMRCRK